MPKLIIVSNRLPVTVKADKGQLEFTESAGGLATGLSSFYQERNAIWIGWPGNVPRRHQAEARARLRSDFAAEPVFITEATVERFYEGYANRTLWPLFHSFPTYTRYTAADWDAYRQVNAQFCRAVLDVFEPGDQVWVHDYQLLLLPGLLRAELPDAGIGFFLHIPFPPYDILRLLPQRREILEHLLGADLIGFHTYDYMDAFLSAVRQVLGYENRLGQVAAGERLVDVDVFPMGIDFERYNSAPCEPEVQDGLAELCSGELGRKIVFSVSRLDYTKGIPQLLRGLDYFLERYPEWRGEIVFVLSVVPSREKVDRYAHLKREIDELVGNINSKYATLAWAPVRYMYRNVPFPELITLYAAANVGLVLPLRDGMNLVAKEYVAAQRRAGGVLVLSDTAGAAKELRQAVIVNPNSREDVAAAIQRALTMPEGERLARCAAMSEWLASHDVRWWAGRFLDQLIEAADAARGIRQQDLEDGPREELLAAYRAASRRLLLLDYDGTLAPFTERPEEARPSPALLDTLRRLAADPANEVVIVSGRDRESLAGWLGELPIRLVAEHGAWARGRDAGEAAEAWQQLGPGRARWKKQVRPILERYVERIPGSFIEEKSFSLAWHYRGAEIAAASMAARELIDGLTNLTANTDIGVLQGHRVVEVKHERITKGGYYRGLLADGGWDFELALGDDWTDETLFQVLPEEAWSIKVGFGQSAARFRLPAPADALALLAGLAEPGDRAAL
jgi:trehalose 6-phosphate synthase/phosphatase